MAIAVSTKSIMHTTVSIWCQVGIAAASLLACIAQFAFGKHYGQKSGERISAGQACGQKNTVFAIWLGYTFLDPVTALAGGFYSIWHNVINSYQLYKMRKAQN
jgi:BASS family bile acid:Na+ symporter